MKEIYLLIGGSRDGEEIAITKKQEHQGWFQVVSFSDLETDVNEVLTASKKTPPGAETSEAKIDSYIIWDLRYRDTNGKEHGWRVARHEDLSEAGAFQKLIENYSKK